MKKITKLAALAVALLMLLSSLVGCSSLGEPVMELEGTQITENMVGFWLSRYKAQFEHYYGTAIASQYGLKSIDEFWPLVANKETGETFDDVMSGYIYENAETYLCALYMFDYYKLSLPKKTVEEVDAYLDTLLEEFAYGSKSEFNAILKDYGINYDILRELYLIDEKVSYLEEYLFSANGPEAITPAKKEEYYQSHYVRMRQIALFINECPEVDDKGEYVLDSDGNTKYRDMTAAETQAARARCDEALKKLKGGETFATVMTEYDENTADDSYTNGLYMSADSAIGTDAALDKIYEELCDMEVGEIRLIETENNLHIVEKLPLDKGAYDVEANSDFFTFYDAELGKYVKFDYYIRTPLFLEYIENKLSEYEDVIKIDEALLKKTKISTVKANYYF